MTTTTDKVSVGVGRWSRMEAELLLAVLEVCGDVVGAGRSLGVSEAALGAKLEAARETMGPTLRAACCVTIEVGAWHDMRARLLLAVVENASSMRSAAAVLGLRQGALRSRVRRARARLAR